MKYADMETDAYSDIGDSEVRVVTEVRRTLTSVSVDYYLYTALSGWAPTLHTCLGLANDLVPGFEKMASWQSLKLVNWTANQALLSYWDQMLANNDPQWLRVMSMKPLGLSNITTNPMMDAVNAWRSQQTNKTAPNTAIAAAQVYSTLTMPFTMPANAAIQWMPITTGTAAPTKKARVAIPENKTRDTCKECGRKTKEIAMFTTTTKYCPDCE